MAVNFIFPNTPYTPPLHDVVNFIFGTSSEVLTLGDSFGFNESFTINLLITLIEDFGFNDSILQMIPISPLSDIFGFNDTLQSIIDYLLSHSDSFGFNDTLTGGKLIEQTISDLCGFNDTLTGGKLIFQDLKDITGFNDSLSSKDFILYWYCRTKIPRYGFGGSIYGDIIGYGEGGAADIAKYLLIVKNSNGTIVRQEEIEITDQENPDIIYWYSYQKNIDDNTTWQSQLTFEIYQIDINDVISEVETISTY